MIENRLANTLRYGATSCGVPVARCETSYQPSQADLEQEKARRLENQRLDMACAIVELAESLVRDHNVSVGTAFETAMEMFNRSKGFIEKFRL